MNDTNVSHLSSNGVLEALAAELGQLTPETRKAATYVLENPNDVGVCSIREMASAAAVKPNTLVRMARTIGFDGYDDFREPFREEIRRGNLNFPDRARWLQSLGQSGQLGGLYADMVESAIRNIEATFAGTNAEKMKAAADDIVASRNTFVLGVGVNNSNARNFAYLADMASYNIWAIPRSGGVASDDLSRANEQDVLIAITCKPYRTEVVEAAVLAKEQGATLIGISDSPASPVITSADHGFVIGSDTPQFFPSSVALIALLETLMAFVIADAPAEVIDNIDRFHERRHRLGIYQP
ncbi:MurR/RpiR family transcriptional regulator [Hwanghaeella grinnelliae]|uniref:MurR/RpiR family transcriptional regulator n=1 Tax=Hwanghaeella grinnelliae TaxID=2500179 RepID=A0A437QX83_9PROT|nr:MurR/RpiR family transcriptional regulator [Hwanghaeella grinnelliae]RVU39036.1 MurR/RpiR family transcriptional regulator [Hwanghaeella grinnelliae]